jgi:hypothetical protein
LNAPPADRGGGLQEYAEYVEKIANADEASKIILSRNSGHAGILVQVMFRKAQNAVEILTGTLPVSIYGTTAVSRAAADFLGSHPKAHLKILMETPIEPEMHPMLNTIEEANVLDRVSLRLLPSELRGVLGFHFLVADGRHFCFDRSRDIAETIAKFNDETMGDALHQKFVDMESQAEEFGEKSR